MRSTYACGLLLAFAALPVLALDSPLESGMRRCADEPDQAARLACFDALVTTIPKVKADEFGMTAEVARKRRAETPQPPPPTPPAELPGKIVTLQLAPRGEIIFTLDNQQVWMQTEVEPAKQFTLGESVHIEQGLMGTYWLAAGKSRKTKVRRIS